MKISRIFLAAFLISSLPLFAGKPWRPTVEQLVPKAELIVTGTVISLQPSLITDKNNHQYSIAEVRVAETLKGTAPEVLHVAVEVEPRYDEKGLPIPRPAAWRYELEQKDHLYLIFLAKPPIAGAVYYVPVHLGSGIIDLSSKRPGDGPEELQQLQEYLREKKP